MKRDVKSCQNKLVIIEDSYKEDNSTLHIVVDGNVRDISKDIVQKYLEQRKICPCLKIDVLETESVKINTKENIIEIMMKNEKTYHKTDKELYQIYLDLLNQCGY